MLEKLREFIASLRRDRAGAVGVFAAVTLPLLVGMSSLVAEYGYVLLVKTENQRVADLAAYAGAVAYTASGTTSAMTSAANAVAALNGVASTNVSATLVNSPTGDGNQAVQVQINTNVPLYMAQVVGAKTTVPVSATSAAELNARASPCVLALSNSGSGITMSGGTSLSANQCTVASNANVTLSGGAQLTTLSVAYDGSVSIGGGAAINTPSGTAAPLVKKSTADPLAGTSQVKAAYAGLANVSTTWTPSGPPAGVGDLEFTNGDSAAVHKVLALANCSAPAPSGSVWNVTCTAGTINNFGKLTTDGGVTLNFDVNATGTTTYTFSGGINTGGGTYTTFGPGIYQIGGGSCGKPTYSICHRGTQLTFKGPSQFVIADGVNTNGGTTLTIGSGASNSFQIGRSSDGYALNLGGGATTILGDAIGSKFQVVGDIVNSGGGCTVISAADEHDINGNISTQGGTVLGAGPYYVTGYFAANGGGDTTCNGMSNVGVLANNVTLVIGGANASSSGCDAGAAFCIGAGYGHVTITGPSSGPLAGLAVVGPQSGGAGASLTAGASGNDVSGAFYFPSGPILLKGGASLGGGTGDCLEIIGSEVTMKGGAAGASNCQSLAGSSASSIMLVQ